MFCVTRVCVSIYIYISRLRSQSSCFVMTFYYWGKYNKEGRRARSLALLSLKGCCFFDALVKRRKRETKGKKETKEAKRRDHFDRVTVAEKV